MCLCLIGKLFTNLKLAIEQHERCNARTKRTDYAVRHTKETIGVDRNWFV